MGLGQSPGLQAHIAWTDALGQPNILFFDVVKSEDWDDGATVTEHPVEIGANVADHVRVQLQKCTLAIHSTNEPWANGGPDQAQPTRGPLLLSVPTLVWDGTPAPPVPFAIWQSNILARALAATGAGAVGNAVGGQGLGAIGAVALESLALQGERKQVVVQTTAGLGNLSKKTIGIEAMTLQWPGPGTDFVEAYHALLVQLKNAAQQFTVYGSKQVCANMVIETLSFHRDPDTGTGEAATIGFKELRIVSTQTVALPIGNLSGGGGNPPAEHGAQELADAQMADTPTVNANRMATIYQQVNNSNLPTGFSIPGLNPGGL